MSSLLKKYWTYLEVYQSVSDPAIRRKLLAEFSKDPNFCKFLREVAKNTLKKNFEIGPKDLKKLRARKQAIVLLTKKYKSTRSRRKNVIQSGSGILPILIPLLAQVIGSLI